MRMRDMQSKAGQAAYVPTGGLDDRRSLRSPIQPWTEATELVALTWHWPDFVTTHRPFDWRID
jgi:hypothetical protein